MMRLSNQMPDGWRSDNQARLLFTILPLTVVLILLGLTNRYFAWLSFAVSVVFLLFADNKYALCLMFFLLPYANIYKLAANSTSFYTYLEFLLAAKLFLAVRQFNLKFVICWNALACVQLIGSHFNLTVFLKQAMIPILIYGYFASERRNTLEITISLAVGLLTSSMIAMGSGVIPGLSGYLRIIRAYDLSGNVLRFSGLYSDPNYYSVTVILTIIKLLVLIKQRRIGTWWFLLCAALVFFGLQTVSKSFFLMLLVLLVIYFAICIKMRQYQSVLFLMAGCFVLFFLIANGKIHLFDSVLERITSGNDLSTGRIALWRSYLESMLASPLQFLIGHGISAPLLFGLAAHNTYIDVLYYYGILGTALVALSIKYAIAGHKLRRDILRSAPAICLLIMYFFLSYLMAYDYAFLIVYVLDDLMTEHAYPLVGKGENNANQHNRAGL